MANSLRFFLFVCAAAVLLFVLRKIKKSQINTMDAVFWIFFSFTFVIFALFPELASGISHLLGFQTSANFIFLYVIAVLVIRDFSMTVKYAQLRERVNELVQEFALRE